ncbi:MAG: formate dehydrogenase accessory sulfurtransferase FdhD [Nitrospirae bacterium]|nr:MAG: formate dehydrogenase accessory sulfurtransferase FdhD [Nitrospirota bacterium]
MVKQRSRKKSRATKPRKSLRPLAGTPARSIDLTQVTEWQAGAVSRVDDYLVGEEPLEIRLGNRPISVTMRTPGHDLELAAGFLLTEGVITGGDQIASLRQGATRGHKSNVVRVDLRAGVKIDAVRLKRNFAATSSCGLCGKASIDAVRVRGIARPHPALRVSPDVLCLLPEALRSAQTLFGRTGGPHAAGLFDPMGKLIALREDVGRHNAVDKLIGWALMEQRLPLKDCLLLVSGRGSFEIVQKALVAGLPIVACISAPSSLAVQLAWEFGLTLIGFLRGKRFVCYSGDDRVRLGVIRGAGLRSHSAVHLSEEKG